MFGTLLKRTWSPWDEVETMERVFDDIFRGSRAVSSPRAEHWVKDDTAHIVLELPGVPTDAVDVSIEGRTIRISGEREVPELGEDETWLRRERWHGKFEKTFTLPFNVEEGEVKATFRHGLLEVSLPKAESEKPRKIAISEK